MATVETGLQVGPRPAMRVAEVRNVTPLDKSGAHSFYQGVMADSGEDVFIKHNRVRELFKSQPMALVNPLVRTAMDIALPNLDRLQDMTEVVFSNFAKGYFESEGRPYSGIAYREVYFEEGGQPHLYIAAPMIHNLGTLEELPASQVSNPQDAVEQTLLRGLVMGDWNCTFRDQNVGVAKADTTVSDGRPLQTGQIIDMDFGDAGTPNIERLGVPYGNRKLLEAYPQCIKPALDHLARLDAEHIRTLLDQASDGVTGWTPELTNHYAGVLTRNLAAAQQKLAEDPQWLTRPSANPLRQPGLSELKQFIFRIPSAYDTYLPLCTSGVTSQVGSEADAAASIQAEKHPGQTAPAPPDGDRDQISRLLRYGSVLPAIGGGFEALYGLRELQHAKTHAGESHEKSDGMVDVVRGSASLAGGLCHLPMYAARYLPSLVHLSHPALLTLGLVGGVAATVNTVFDGGRDIYNGIVDHRPSDIGWGAVKVLAGALEVVGSFTLNVPMMVASNAIFAAAAAIQNRHAVAKAVHKGIELAHRVAQAIVPPPLAAAHVAEFDKLLDTAHPYGYQQSGYEPVDPFGDACLIKRLSRIPRDITHATLQHLEGVVERLAPRNHESQEAAAPAVEPFEIRHDPPLDVEKLTTQFLQDAKASGLAPTLGEEHRWSPPAEDYLHLGFVRGLGRFAEGKDEVAPPFLGTSKLFLMLADGQTPRYAVTGQEEGLKTWAMGQRDYSILPHDLLRESYRLNGGDLYKTFLTCENVLNPDWKNPQRAQDPLQQKLAYIRNDSAPRGDKYGAWYHFVGAALYALMRPELMARSVADIEAVGSYVMGGPDPQEDAMNRLGARFGSELRRLLQDGQWDAPRATDTHYMLTPNLQA